MRYGFSAAALLVTMFVAGARQLCAQTVRYGVMGDSVTARIARSVER